MSKAYRRIYKLVNGITRADGNLFFFEADFTTLPLSTDSNSAALTTALTAKGFTLTRASAATVQTSTTTVVTDGIGVDAPRVGNAGYGQGLVIEAARTSYAYQSEDFKGVNWGTPAYVTQNTTTAPNGTLTADKYTLVGVSANALNSGFNTSLASSYYTPSFWIKQNNASDLVMHKYLNPPGAFSLVSDYRSSLTPGVWVRKDFTTSAAVVSGVALTHYIHYELANGQTGDSELWGYSIENGTYPTEYIPSTTAGTTRALDYLVYNGDLVSSGRIGLEFRFIPKMSSADLIAGGAPIVLWQALTAPFDYVAIGAFANPYVVRNSVAEYSSAIVMAWARGDVIDYFVEAGGGALASKAWYRVNGGATIALDVGAVIASNMQTSATSNMFGSGAYWAQQVRAYAPDVRPTWCV
jgi:hypothetical protein